MSNYHEVEEEDVKVVNDLGQLRDEYYQMKIAHELGEFKDKYYQRDIW